MIVDPRTQAVGPERSFFDNFGSMADNFALYLMDPLNADQFAAYADGGAASAMTLPDAPREVGQGVSDALDGTLNAARSTAVQVALWGFVGLAGFLVLERAAKR